MILVGTALLAGAAEQQLPVVESLDVERYMGKWYAIASIPTSFERKCIQGTTAEYTLLENGQVQVVNTCYNANGNLDVARGRAWIPDPKDPAKLQVSFVNILWFWLFSAPYWVIDLAISQARIDMQQRIRCYCCHEMCPNDAIELHTSPLYRVVNR